MRALKLMAGEGGEKMRKSRRLNRRRWKRKRRRRGIKKSYTSVR